MGSTLKIVSVEPIPVAYPEPNDFDASRSLCLVKVTTDDGVIGWGEAITQFPAASFAVAPIVRDLSQLLVGEDPTQTQALWHRMKDAVWWYGYGGGIASFAVAALDIALWDLKGKATGRSVLDLLGGAVHDRLPAIASSHAHHDSIPAMVVEAEEWMSSGFHGMKVGFGKRGNARLGFDHDRDVEYVKRMREVLGSHRALMIDCGNAVKWDVSTAVRRVQAFDDYGIAWIEEPLGPWDPAGYADLRAKTRALIAYGEREWQVEGYEHILQTGTCDVLGVDPGRAEGITGFKLITDRIEAHRRQANAHAWSSAIVSAASLAVSFSSPACRLFELKPLRNPMQHDLVVDPIEHVDGWVYPPTGTPGLGVEIVEDVVDRYRI
jgi:L-alanine-DL-glutamate epimerase-like enolase superfamily enzyme